MNTISNNTVAILSDLSGAMQSLDASKLIAPDDSVSPAFITAFGIRSLALNVRTQGLTFPGLPFTTPGNQNISRCKWQRYKNEVIIEELKSLFTNCPIISFADWSDTDGASSLWDGLLSDVIKPLHKKDFEFIFYLGDPTKSLVQEVDEILDIISNFSLYGRVTLVLDEEEASRLWMALNGYGTGIPVSAVKLPCQGEQCLSIFNTMKIDHLLVCSVDKALSFSRQTQFELADRPHHTARTTKEVRNHFNTGYSLGLRLRWEIPRCVALGLAVSGSYKENGGSPDRSALLSYIKQWMAEAGQPDNHAVGEMKAAV